MRVFMVRAPDGRLLQREAESVESIMAGLIEGFVIDHEIINGVKIPPLPDHLKHHTLMSYLLSEHGEELKTWLRGWLGVSSL